MVDINKTNVVGLYCWGQPYFSEYVFAFFGDGTFKTYKSPEEDYNRPMCAFGTSYNASGQYKVEAEKIILNGSGTYKKFGRNYEDSILAKEEKFTFVKTFVIAELQANRKGDDPYQYDKLFKRLDGDDEKPFMK